VNIPGSPEIAFRVLIRC